MVAALVVAELLSAMGWNPDSGFPDVWLLSVCKPPSAVLLIMPAGPLLLLLALSQPATYKGTD